MFMTPQQKKAIMHDIPLWVYRSLLGSATAVILYFVIDIHRDFEKQKEHIRELQVSRSLHSEQITNSIYQIKALQIKCSEYDNNVQNFYRKYGGALDRMTQKN